MPTCWFTCFSWAVEGPEDLARIRAQAARGAALLGATAVLSPLCTRFAAPESWLPVEERVGDLDQALSHEVLWSVRGGHGAVHLLPHLLARAPTRTPLLIAYSDGTVFHALWRARGWGETWYGSLGAVEQAGRAHDSLARLAQGQGLHRAHASDPMVITLRPGTAHGPLVPVCLSVLAWLVGTPAATPLAGCILAVEDIDLSPFMADYCLHQLAHAGLLAGITGLIGGGFENSRISRSGMTINDVLRQWADRLGVPAIANLPFGHIDDGLVLPSGRPGELRVGGDGDWSLDLAERSARLQR